MSLRTQLVALSLLLLSLPWAGCQYLREMESTLRQGQGMAASATARAVASALGERPELLYPVRARRSARTAVPDWYIAAAKGDLVSDGYTTDWVEQPTLQPQAGTPAGISLYTATRRQRLHVLLEVDDDTLRYRTPNRRGDRVQLECIDALGARSRYELSAEAPGLLMARSRARRDDSLANAIRGAWRERVRGYAVEFQLPLDTRCQRLGIQVIDARGDERSPDEITRFDSRQLWGGVSPWLVYRVAELDDWLTAFGEAGRTLTVRDAAGWVVGQASGGAPRDRADAAAQLSDGQVFWLLRAIYRLVLGDTSADDVPVNDGNAAESGWHTVVAADDGSLRLEARASVIQATSPGGSVELSETTERYLALTDRATTRVFAISLLVLFVAFAALLGYASLLSWRIRRLRDAASNVAAQTLTADDFPRSRAADELGDLSRSYADLLRQISDYNQYLRGLARTLSHELRTPIAVVSSSLDNLHTDNQSDNEHLAFVQRAQTGLSRLTRIVAAMSEASRIEESVQGAPRELLDLNDLVSALVQAYSSSYPSHTFNLDTSPAPPRVVANGDLIAQALDKLVDNATGFATPGTPIEIRVRRNQTHCEVDVINQGSALPTALRERLFEPMVSVRGAGSESDTHLGLGLHIARAIASAQEGELVARDLPGGAGVVFTLSLPLAE